MIWYLRENDDLLSTLIIINILTIILCLVCNLTSISDLFSTSSCIISGIESVLGVIIFLVFIYILIGFLPKNSINHFATNVINKIKNPYLVNFISCSVNSVFILIVSNNTAAMSIQSCFVDKLYKNKSQIDKASIFDGLSCGVAGI